MRQENKKYMIIGMFSMFLFMIGDWLLDWFEIGNEKLGEFVYSGWSNMQCGDLNAPFF